MAVSGVAVSGEQSAMQPCREPGEELGVETWTSGRLGDAGAMALRIRLSDDEAGHEQRGNGRMCAFRGNRYYGCSSNAPFPRATTPGGTYDRAQGDRKEQTGAIALASPRSDVGKCLVRAISWLSGSGPLLDRPAPTKRLDKSKKTQAVFPVAKNAPHGYHPSL